jgi:hypothetical protein
MPGFGKHSLPATLPLIFRKILMTTPSPESLVVVYSTPLAFDAELVKAMLKDEGILGFVEESNAPFAGLSSIPCHVMVELQHETRARELVEEHEAIHRERVQREEMEQENELSEEQTEESPG